jgi:puromycin-sensitive aminopeptidase
MSGPNAENQTSAQDPDKLAYRLPRHIWPISYHIDLHTDPGRADFQGAVTIEMDVQRESSAIEMHARDLQITEARLDSGGGPVPLGVELDPERQRVIFTPQGGASVPPGRATLHATFAGRPSPNLHGLYLATDGHERMICTQCEATDARAIFPCFDEPEFKASLTWTLRTGPGLVALSNGALAGIDKLEGTIEAGGAGGAGLVHRFRPTRKVASYLAALVVGDLEGSEETVVRGTPIRVWGPRGKVAQTRFAHEFTERLLPWYEDYFDYAYPYGKYDQVGVPGFDAGAMENIGLVLFRQNLLLMDPRTTSWRQEKMVARVVAHEFAHMWFGNLVTMRWWDDLWLNEAFAEWMAHKATDALSPGYLVWSDFQDDKNRALIDDALPTTHPIWTPVQTPAEAIEMFDAITYQKGCAVMRMLENFLGEAPFREGLRRYMKDYAESNAAGPDLWQKLSEASGHNVGELMGSWVTQSGFPLLSVSLRDGRLRLSQRRFYSSPRDMAAPCAQRWHVPVVVRYEDDEGTKEHRFILRAEGADPDAQEQITEEALPSRGEIRWCYANAGEVGFYRQDPDAALREALLRHAERLQPVEQMGFIEDQWALVRNATHAIEPFLQVLARFAVVRDHNVLRAVVDRLGTLDLLLKDAGDREARLRFRGWVAELLCGQLEELGYSVQPGEDQNTIQRRAMLAGAVASLARVPASIEKAQTFAELERLDPRAVDPNLAGVFVGVAAKFGDAERYDEFVRTYLSRKAGGATPQETLRYLYSLAAFRWEGLVQRTLTLIEDGTIPQESIGPVLGQLLSQRHAQEHAWQHLKAGWLNLRERIGDMGLSRVVEAVGHLRPVHREDIVAFFQKNPPRGADRALARALEAMDQREELRQRVTPELLRYFLSRP